MKTTHAEKIPNKKERTFSSKPNSEDFSTTQKYNNFWNKLFLTLFPFSIVSLFYFIRDISDWRRILNSYNPHYKLPGWSDLKICLYWTIIIALIKIISIKPFEFFCSRIMKKSYQDPKTDSDRELAQKYKVKLPDHLFKIIFYSLMSIFGFCILRNLDYFPKSLGGTGYFPNVIKKGYPGSFFDTKPRYFTFYYMFNLAFFSFDSVWFFIMPKQIDFITMIVHHICTIFLIIFSYFTNISHVGCVVLYLHVFSDIFVHLAKFFIQTDAPEYITGFFGILVVFVFWHTRIFVLGNILYSLWRYSDFSWHRICYFLYVFLVVIFLMQIEWSIMLLYKLIKLVSKGRISDNSGFNTKNLENEKSNEQKQKKI